jgi:hypothetical protein
VGDGGVIVGTSAGGSAWTPQSSGVTVVLRGIICPGTSTCFADGDSGVILGTTTAP